MVLVVARQIGPAIAGGIVIGVIGARAAGRVLESMLFEVAATDIATFIDVTAVMVVVAVVAGFVPARRATQVHPAAVLREE